MNGADMPQAIGQTLGGAALAGAPWWIQLVAELNVILAFFTGLCGFVIAAYGVYRIFRKSGDAT